MSKKEKARWGRVSRGDGAGSSDFLNQLEAYERGEISAKSVKFTRDNPGTQTEESDNERRDERPQKPQHQKPNRPKAPASPPGMKISKSIRGWHRRKAKRSL